MKKVFIALVAILCMITATGCNRDMIDTVLSYDKVIISMPDGSVIKGNVESWKDYDDGEQLQIKVDGKTYLVHAENVCLIKEED